MQRQSSTKPGTAKANSSAPEVTLESAAVWGKHAKQPQSPAPPPVWTRYIDSRLKQFNVR